MKKYISRSLCAVLLLFSAASSFGEALSAQKREDTKALLEVTGALKVGKAMSEAIVNQMSQSIKQARPDIPAKVFTILADEVNSIITEEMNAKEGLIDLMVMLYHRHFTHQEIQGLLAFYQTPLGKKAGALAPVMSQEGFALGQRWGQSLGPVIMQRVKARLGKEGVQL